MEQDLQKLTVQHKELQRSYEVLMNFATSAPPTCNLEIEIPEDLRFIDDVPHIDIEIEKLQSHNQQLSLVSSVDMHAQSSDTVYTCSQSINHTQCLQ